MVDSGIIHRKLEWTENDFTNKVSILKIKEVKPKFLQIYDFKQKQSLDTLLKPQNEMEIRSR